MKVDDFVRPLSNLDSGKLAYIEILYGKGPYRVTSVIDTHNYCKWINGELVWQQENSVDAMMIINNLCPINAKLFTKE